MAADLFTPEIVGFGSRRLNRLWVIGWGVSITTKFCIVTKITKYSSCVAPTHVKQIQDGGRPPSWKIENRPYLRNGSTDPREIWYVDAYGASEPERKLKCSTFENPRWRTAAILKIENLLYLQNGPADLREIWQDDAHCASEPDRKLKFPTFRNPRWRTATILKNGKSAIEQYLLMLRPVRVKSAIHRVGKSRIICYVICFTYFT